MFIQPHSNAAGLSAGNTAILSSPSPPVGSPRFQEHFAALIDGPNPAGPPPAESPIAVSGSILAPPVQVGNGTSQNPVAPPASPPVPSGVTGGLAVSSQPNPFNPAGGVRYATPSASPGTTSGTTTPSASGAANPQDAAPAPPTSPLDVLREALRRAGIDPGSLNMTEVRETVGYPGGSYENHLIRIVNGGRTENLSVPLLLANAGVAVGDIRRFIG